jgi:hypothetical protein
MRVLMRALTRLLTRWPKLVHNSGTVGALEYVPPEESWPIAWKIFRNFALT